MNTRSAGESSRLAATTSSSLSATSSSANAAVAGTADPVTRSRTNFFLSIRASSVRPPRTSSRRYSLGYDPDSAYGIDAPSTANEESQGLLSGIASTSGGGPHSGVGGGRLSPSHVAITLNPEPPNWVDISERVNEILGRTKTKIAQLDKLHAKHALPGFADRSAEEREIETLTTDITRDFRKCQALIQQISPGSSSSSSSGGGAESHTFPPSSSGPPSRHQVLAAQNVQRGLAAKVQDLSGAFRKKQRVYMQTLQGHAIKNQDLLVASGAITLKGSDSLTALQEDVEASRSQLKQRQTQQQQLAVVNAEPDLQTRSREITEIAKSIASLAEVFKDLSNLVIDQGTILDSVEYNIEQTAIHVQEAAKDLDVATKYQKNIGRRKCIFLLLIIIVGLILVLIFKPRRHGGGSSSPAPTPSAHESEARRLLRFAIRS
ncbi:hypothetical protein FS837_004685 [Tulasnella sp. UAMH 9824]|nr:hypothetical protein FS837_004685 [Tulasnella sp. UAMH 9824]